MSIMKSFRGKLADSEQQRISLSTNNGLTGYTIKKFELMPIDADEDVESTVKVYSVEQSTVDADIDFNQNTLLAVGIIRAGTGVSQPLTVITVFDNVKFNQDIFISYRDNETADKTINYYIELEQIKLNLDEATVATLKDMRGRE